VPETRTEKLVFALGLCAIIVLAVLIAVARGESSSSTPEPSPPKTTKNAPAPVRTRPVTTATTRTVSTSEAPRRKTVTPPARANLRLTAARADSWMEVRAGSAQGTVLYVGILTQGDSRTFRAKQVWVRFGNAGNVDARLNGRPLALAAGTYSAVIDRTGLTGTSPG
jgi:hypothetical protein